MAPDELTGWLALSATGGEVRLFPGGHLFHLPERDGVIELLRHMVTRWMAP